MAPFGDAGGGLRELGVAHGAVDARDPLPAAPVPGRGDRERRREAPAQGGVALPALHAGDQPLRAADRLRRAARTSRAATSTPTPSCSRCRWRSSSEGAGAAGVHRRAVGGHRHGDRRDHRALDHGVQRPGDADPAALEVAQPRARAATSPRCCSTSAAARSSAILLLGYFYFRIAGEAYALVSIGLISFAAVAQFAPGGDRRALLEGRHARGRARGAVAPGFAVWLYTLLLPAFAKSGWLGRSSFLEHGPVRHRAAAARRSSSASRASTRSPTR